jgi:hypothetical protein
MAVWKAVLEFSLIELTFMHSATLKKSLQASAWQWQLVALSENYCP